MATIVIRPVELPHRVWYVPSKHTVTVVDSGSISCTGSGTMVCSITVPSLVMRSSVWRYW